MNAPAIVANRAAEINLEHDAAHRDAASAVAHAIRAGELLLSVKASLKHGEFMPWIEQNCKFEQSTATRYMAAARQIATGVAISSLRSLFDSGRKHRVQGDADDGDGEVHGGHVAGGGGVDRVAVMPIADIKIMPPGYWRERAECQPQFKASLIDAWNESSDETRTWFLHLIYERGEMLPLIDKSARAKPKAAA